MLPSRARTGPPDIGASTVSRPKGTSRRANASTSSGASVGHSMTTLPKGMAGASPCGPNSTASVCAASTTATTQTTELIATTLGWTWPTAPNDAKACSRSGRTSQTRTGQPRASRRCAMAPPIWPTPTTLTGKGVTRSVMTAPVVWIWQSTSTCQVPIPRSPWPCRRS